MIERARALALVFRLAREERDAWVTWPARAAALMAAELSAGCRAWPDCKAAGLKPPDIVLFTQRRRFEGQSGLARR